MKKTIRYEIRTIDRKGMILDVLKVLYEQGIDIKALEVKPGIIYKDP